MVRIHATPQLRFQDRRPLPIPIAEVLIIASATEHDGCERERYGLTTFGR